MKFLENAAQDVRIAVRALGRAPIVVIVILLSVGLGIGVTATVFSAGNGALLRPLPYAGAGRLVRIYTDSPPNRFPLSVADYQALVAQQTRFEQIAAYASNAATFSDGASSERVKGRSVSPGYFELLGIQPILGHTFGPDEGRQGGPRLVIVSHAFWQRWCGGRADAIGKPLRFDGVACTRKGVVCGETGAPSRAWTSSFPRSGPCPHAKARSFSR
jgi:hypothetical protein